RACVELEAAGVGGGATDVGLLSRKTSGPSGTMPYFPEKRLVLPGPCLIFQKNVWSFRDHALFSRKTSGPSGTMPYFPGKRLVLPGPCFLSTIHRTLRYNLRILCKQHESVRVLS